MTSRTNGKGVAADSEPRLLAETAYITIKRSIVCCELEPGQQITEEQLAARFGVGRAAVRAALKRLYQEQFIQSVTRHRYVVTPITLKHVQELFELRMLLEPAAARRAAGRIDAQLLRHLSDLSEASYEVGNRQSAEAFLTTNTEFHALVAQASGNSLLASMVRGLLDKVERVHHMSHLLHDRNETAYHEHHELLEALMAGDAERAEQVMIQQIEAARAFVLDAMIASPSIQSVNVANS